MHSFRARLFQAATSFSRMAIKPIPMASVLTSAVVYGAVKTSYEETPLLATKRNYVTKGSNHELIDDEADLSVCPEPSDLPFDENCQITIGDLHANAMKLMYFLIRENVLEANKEAYNTLFKIYFKPVKDLTAEDVTNFQTALDSIKVNRIPHGAMVRLIGDDLCDRGYNDYFVLLVLKKLHRSSVPFIVLFSNHGSEYLQVYEKSLLMNKSYLEEYEDEGFGQSLTNMRTLVIRGLVAMSEIDDIMKEVYLPHLRLLSCTIQDLPGYVLTSAKYYLAQFDDFSSITEKELLDTLAFLSDARRATIYTHAPIGLNTVKAIAASSKFNVSFSDATPAALASTIQAINETFSQSVQANRLLADYESDIMAKAPSYKIPLSTPMRRTIWSRGQSPEDVPPHQMNGFTLYFAFGHDGVGKVPDNGKDHLFNVDNKFGKRDKTSGRYTILYSHENSEYDRVSKRF